MEKYYGNKCTSSFLALNLFYTGKTVWLRNNWQAAANWLKKKQTDD